MQITKRDGRVVDFDVQRIINAVQKAMTETTEGIDLELCKNIALSIEQKLNENAQNKTVEEIQDLVEQKLMESNRKDVAKKYILYRDSRNNNRATKEQYKLLDDEFISKYKHLPNPMTPLGEFVYYRTYSRWLPSENRREYWWETCRRAVEFNCGLVEGTTKEEAQQLFDNMYHLRQFPSGRTMWVAQTLSSIENPQSNYNCGFVKMDDYIKFKELFLVLMLGAGIGVRILKSDIAKLPKIRHNVNIVHEQYKGLPKNKRNELTSIEFVKNTCMITIGDSRDGWSSGLEWLLRLLYDKSYKKIENIIISYNHVRPKGEKLLTFGGRASGYESLQNMFVKIFEVLKRAGQEQKTNWVKLRPIHCLDITNIIGENVVSGAVRRTSLIMLIDQDDKECIEAKNGLYYQDENGIWKENLKISHRKMSNNSIYYTSKPSREYWSWHLKQMRYSGEPGIINAESALTRRADFEGLNPCSEILLRDRGMCNLTSLNVMGFVKNGMLNKQALLEAQRLSARMGLRMTCVDFELHSWDIVQKEDRLLGCSLMGWQDMINETKMTKEEVEDLWQQLRLVANNEAEKYALELNIPKPLLATTYKPDGSIAQLPTVSSGIHFAHSPYYIRRVRISSTDPLVKVCEELGYPVFPENGQDWETCNTKVVEFPVKSPKGKTKYDVGALEQLDTYKSSMKNYVDHNCSITVHVRNEEWQDVEQWMWDNWDDAVGISFLSLDDNFYPLLPYEAITEEEYNKRLSEMKPFIPSLITKYEKEETEEADIVDDSCATGICPPK